MINSDFKQGEKAQEYVSPVIQEEPISETANGKLSDQMELKNNMTVDSPEMILKTFVSTRKTRLPTDSLEIQQRMKPSLHTGDSNQVLSGKSHSLSFSRYAYLLSCIT